MSGLTSKSDYFKAGSSIRLAGLLDIDVYTNSIGASYGIAGAIVDGSSAASLNKGGHGSRYLELKGNNSYTGSTTIEAGYLKITNDSPHSFLNNTTITGPGHLKIEPENTNFGSTLSMSDINFSGTQIRQLHIGKSGTSTKLVLDENISTDGEIYLRMPVEVNGGDRSISSTNDNIRFYSTIDSDTTAARSLTINS